MGILFKYMLVFFNMFYSSVFIWNLDISRISRIFLQFFWIISFYYFISCNLNLHLSFEKWQRIFSKEKFHQILFLKYFHQNNSQNFTGKMGLPLNYHKLSIIIVLFQVFFCHSIAVLNELFMPIYLKLSASFKPKYEKCSFQLQWCLSRCLCKYFCNIIVVNGPF